MLISQFVLPDVFCRNILNQIRPCHQVIEEWETRENNVEQKEDISGKLHSNQIVLPPIHQDQRRNQRPYQALVFEDMALDDDGCQLNGFNRLN